MYRERILAFAKERELFTTRELQEALQVQEHREMAKLNTEMKRLCDRGTLVRYRRGIYSRPLDSGNGGKEEQQKRLVQFLYTSENAGYLSGPDYMRSLGIDVHKRSAGVHLVASNRIRRSGDHAGTRVESRFGEITPENLPYLQMLDCIRDLDRYAADGEAAAGKACAEIRRQHLDWLRLLAMAVKYYPRRVAKWLLGCLESDYEEMWGSENGTVHQRDKRTEEGN